MNTKQTRFTKKKRKNKFFVLFYPIGFFIYMYRKIQEWDCSQVKNRFGTIGMREREKNVYLGICSFFS